MILHNRNTMNLIISDKVSKSSLKDSIKKVVWEPTTKYIPNLKSLSDEEREKYVITEYDLNYIKRTIFSTMADYELSDKRLWVYLNNIYEKVDIIYTPVDLLAYIAAIYSKKSYLGSIELYIGDIYTVADMCFNQMDLSLYDTVKQYSAFILKYGYGNLTSETENTLFRTYETVCNQGTDFKLIVPVIYRKDFENNFSKFIEYCGDRIEDLTEKSTTKIPKMEIEEPKKVRNSEF